MHNEQAVPNKIAIPHQSVRERGESTHKMFPAHGEIQNQQNQECIMVPQRVQFHWM